MTEIPEKALKMITLALDSAAQDGEWRNAAVLFVKILREANFPPQFFDVKSRFKEATKKQQDSRVKMPFGKFKGTPIEDVPDWYLSWMWDNISLREPFKSFLHEELLERGLF